MAEAAFNDDRPRALAYDVVICTCDPRRHESIIESLNVLAAQTVPPGQVVVVRDSMLAGAPDYHSRVAHADRTTIVVHQLLEGSGTAAARNAGIAACQSRIVLFLDDDATPATDTWAEELIGEFGDSDVVGVGGSAVAAWPYGTRPRWFPERFNWTVGCTMVAPGQPPSDTRVLVGCNMGFLRGELLAAGGFAEEFTRNADSGPTGCDEIELCIRMLRSGSQRMRFVPSAFVIHRVTAERTTARYFSRRCFLEGRSRVRLVRATSAREVVASLRAGAVSPAADPVRQTLVISRLAAGALGWFQLLAGGLFELSRR